MKLKKYTLQIVAAAAMMLTACQVEFSPNAEYRETPVVYCLLDQDDDTVWARVEKCFLVEGNIYEYGSSSEMINFPQGYITVSLIASRWGVPVDTLILRDTLCNRDDGLFASQNQPLFFNTAHLDTTCNYHLEVRRAADDSLMAYTDPIPLILKTESTLITQPYNTRPFGFNDYSAGTRVCNIAWNSLRNARRYQPIVRFFYGEDGDTHYVDLKCAHVTSGANITAYPLESFLNSLKNALQDDPNPKEYLKYVEIYLTACDENLNVYINNVASGVSLNQTADTYTNVHGGLGIFAARRTHLFKYLDADPSMNPLSSSNPGLYSYLHALGIGF
ncbi:MAG: hypothetical protein K6E96_09765 [Bacteroidales bacterium]|nr:hypothetical protein [Bacteroidales bacterium]